MTPLGLSRFLPLVLAAAPTLLCSSFIMPDTHFRAQKNIHVHSHLHHRHQPLSGSVTLSVSGTSSEDPMVEESHDPAAEYGSSSSTYSERSNNNVIDNHRRMKRKLSKKSDHHDHKMDWIKRSLKYYSSVLRDNSGREEEAINFLLSQQRRHSEAEEDDRQHQLKQKEYIDKRGNRKFINMATKHYYANQQIKKSNLKLAENIYRSIIGKIMSEQHDDGEHCDHASLAVSTLLLALLLQRMGDIKGTRSVFLNFFRTVMAKGDNALEEECACSAKVFQAYALFEMKRGNKAKSYEIVNMAIKLDKSLAPVLNWKQFKDAKKVHLKYSNKLR